MSSKKDIFNAGDVRVGGIKIGTPHERAMRIAERAVEHATNCRVGSTLAERREAIKRIIAAEVLRELEG